MVDASSTIPGDQATLADSLTPRSGGVYLASIGEADEIGRSVGRSIADLAYRGASTNAHRAGRARGHRLRGERERAVRAQVSGSGLPISISDGHEKVTDLGGRRVPFVFWTSGGAEHHVTRVLSTARNNEDHDVHTRDRRPANGPRRFRSTPVDDKRSWATASPARARSLRSASR